MSHTGRDRCRTPNEVVALAHDEDELVDPGSVQDGESILLG